MNRKRILLFLIPLTLIFQSQSGCNSNQECPEGVWCTFTLTWNKNTHPNRDYSNPSCDFDLGGPVNACGDDFDQTTFNEANLGNQAFRNHHLFLVQVRAQCEDLNPTVTNYVPVPSNSNNCLSFDILLPDDLKVDLDITYIEACNDCYASFSAGICGDYYRTKFFANTSIIPDVDDAFANKTNVQLNYEGSYCSNSDNCENHEYKMGI